jgi:4-oxalomesaconate tautomerase
MVNSNAIRCMLMRGGTSKGLYFVGGDLPEDEDERNHLLLSIMGSPDPRQIDGLGGAHSLTSKVAVVSPSEHGADVDYLFLQLGVDRATVSDQQNCGNLLAGVGQFAMERGMVSPTGDRAAVDIFMVNTSSRAISTFPVRDAAPVYAGATTISGVPGSAAAVRLDFAGIEGSTCGRLLPTGNAVDMVEGVPCTLIDNGMPAVVMRAEDVGATGYETTAELRTDHALRQRVESIRLIAGELMNLGDVRDKTVPKMTLVAPPKRGGNLSTRSFIPHTPHDAIGVLAAVSVATAARLPRSPAATMLQQSGDAETVLLEHPTGVFEAAVGVTVTDDGTVKVGRAGIVRTARKLMDGTSFAKELN